MRKTVFTFLSLVVFSGLAAEQTVRTEIRDGDYHEYTEETITASPGGHLILDTYRGNIRIVTWDRKEVRLEVHKRVDVFTENEAKAAFKDIVVNIRKAGDTIDAKVFSQSRRGRRSVSVSIEVTTPKSFNVTVETGGGNVTIDDLDGNAEASTSGGNITVGTIRNGRVKVNTSGGNITVDDIIGGDLNADTSGGNIRAGRVDGTIVARTAGGNITVGVIGKDARLETSGGNIRVTEVGVNLRANTSGGNITAGKVGGDIDADTAGGSIRIGPAGGSIKADTAGGSITIRGSGGPVEANTAGGNIRIENAGGSIEADTAGGNITAYLVTSDKNVDTHCSLRNSGGEISLYLPEHLSATVKADLRIRGGRDKNYRIYTDFPLEIKGEGTHRLTASGDINGGGDPIRLSTTNGNIKILKLDRKEGSQ